MSYCRFSSDNWMSDVYVYPHVDGCYVIHVTAKRLLFPPIPSLPWGYIPMFGAKYSFTEKRIIYPNCWSRIAYCTMVKIWMLSERLNVLMVGYIPRRAPKLGYDGRCLVEDTPLGCLYRLNELRRLGYRVPLKAIFALERESIQDVFTKQPN